MFFLGGMPAPCRSLLRGSPPGPYYFLLRADVTLPPAAPGRPPAIGLGCVERLYQGANLAFAQQPLAAVNLGLTDAFQGIAEFLRAYSPLQRLVQKVVQQAVEFAGFGFAADNLAFLRRAAMVSAPLRRHHTRSRH
jgi:hypothetical protein